MSETVKSESNEDQYGRKEEKYNNKIVSAYIYDHANGKSIQVSCPRRLLDIVQEDAKLSLLKNLRVAPRK